MPAADPVPAGHHSAEAAMFEQQRQPAVVSCSAGAHPASLPVITATAGAGTCSGGQLGR